MNLKALGAGYKRDPNAGMNQSHHAVLSSKHFAEAVPRVHTAENVDLKALGAGYKRAADAGKITR